MESKTKITIDGTVHVKKELLQKKHICKCGHEHISYAGDLGKNNDKEGYVRLLSCDKCNCEKYIYKKVKPWKKQVEYANDVKNPQE